ncbi:MAG: hypothetical protein PUJ57_06145 [Peptoniphilaceae bacterium]|nr:hypothetical protein [Peptoniphilaceae bacterium]MDY6085731.1 hypothetical protein [Peptoniphilaceae bacterium]
MIRSDFYRVSKRRRLWLLLPIYLILLVMELNSIFTTDMAQSLQDVDWFVQAGSRTIWPPLFPTKAYLIHQYLVYFIVALPASDLFIEDAKTQFLEHYQMHAKREKYALSHYMSNFIIAGLAGVLPLLCISWLDFMMVPSVGTHPINMNVLPADRAYLYDLFFDHFWLYFFIVQIRAFLGCGLIGAFSMAINNTFHNSYVGYVLPLFIMQLSVELPVIGDAYLVTELPSSVSKIGVGGWIFVLLMIAFILYDVFKQMKGNER